MILKRLAVSLFLIGFLGAAESHAQVPKSTGQKDDPRLERILSRLTLEEKLSLLGGTGFETKPIPRLGIPTLNMTDGPVGVRWKASSAFPVSIMMAAGCNPALIKELGAALGQEAKAKGRRMLLGPCVNIQRVPFDGRNFESFGEDPYLSARMAAEYVKGVQSEKVIATTKHFACNNQEFERDFTNVTVSERALREIYLPAFEAAVTEGGSMSVMSAYNKVNGAYCSENAHLLSEVLKADWQFRGFVVSDWGAVHSTIPTANAGLDVEMPEGRYLNADSLLPAIRSGKVAVETVNDKVRRLLRAMFWAGLFDGGEKDKGSLNTPQHRKIALDVARDGIVLLKNDRNTLPLDGKQLKSVAVIGPNAAVARTGGGGSAKVDPIYAVSPLDGMRHALGKKVDVRYAPGFQTPGELQPVPSSSLIPAGGLQNVHGLKGEYFANMTLAGNPVLTRTDPIVSFDWGEGSPDPVLPRDSFSVRWTGKLVVPASGLYTLSVASDDGVRLFIDSNQIIENWSKHPPELVSKSMTLEAGRAYDVRIEYFESTGGALMRFGWSTTDAKLTVEAVNAARGADAALVFVGLSADNESEGFDRRTLDLPPEQVALIKEIAAVNSRTVVILNSGAPIVMEDWLKNVPALLEAWYPGEEGGNAVADVLLGNVNPSGKLPATFLRKWEDAPAFGNYPGSGSVNYAEDVFVGYRHFDLKNKDVTFPFGYGLSYTTFAFSNLVITPGKKTLPVSVQVDIRNTGTMAGAEVVQLYVHDDHSKVERPPKELKGFEKVMLKPGQTKRVTFMLDKRSFAYYDVQRKDWNVDPGNFEIQVGNSSRDIKLTGTVEIK